jgi:hypothetical protein
MNPEKMKELRPISLCNVLYKIVSKVLANRLKLILPEIIAPNQSAFVPGRLITDNILLAYEVTHFMQNKRCGADGFAALKLDMSKAYDRVEWNFLEKMMIRLGFAKKWIDIILECCSTIKYKFKINGSLTEELIPERGLRQGDPISPYLFLLCAEAFSSLLNSAETRGELVDVKICPNTPSFNHLLFADDSLILMKVTPESSQHLQNILQLYEVCSGHTINVEKSAIMFSKNTNSEAKKEMMTTLGVFRVAWNEKYLGLPVYVGRNRAKIFAYLKDKIRKLIQGWKEKMLSKVGKEILIKACAQAIPIFSMTCFDITKGLCDEINAIICRHWWAYQDNESKMHWLSWDKLTKSKKEGGLATRTSMLSIWRCWPSKLGGCSRILIPSVPVFLKPDTILRLPSWRRMRKKASLILGAASSKAFSCSRRESLLELGMEAQLISGMTLGCLVIGAGNLSLLVAIMCSPWSRSLWIR